MKLISRGLTFDYDPAKSGACRPSQRTNSSQTPYELIYRGNKYRVAPNAIAKRCEAQSAKPSVQPFTYELIYRAITFWVHRNEQGKVTALAPICKPFKETKLKAIFDRFMAD